MDPAGSEGIRSAERKGRLPNQRGCVPIECAHAGVALLKMSYSAYIRTSTTDIAV